LGGALAGGVSGSGTSAFDVMSMRVGERGIERNGSRSRGGDGRCGK